MQRFARFSIPFKIFILAAGILGLWMELGIGTADFSLTKLRMFTALSNLAVVLYYIYHLSAAYRNRLSAGAVKWKVLITLGIVLTGLVAHFMLRDVYLSLPVEYRPVWWIQHYIVPISTFVDWLVFDERGQMKWWMPLFATSFPLIYCAITMFVVAGLGIGDYPYPFLDVNTLGAGPVILAILGLSAGFIIVGYLLYGYDHLITYKKNA